MAQNLDVARPQRHYTRADFTALRAWLNKLPLARIATLYYSEDDLDILGCGSPAALGARLDDLRDQLIERASLANPHVAEALAQARRSQRWSRVALDFLVQAADRDMRAPRPADAVSVWFKPRVARSLKGEKLETLADLMAWIAARGAGWWRPLPRLGKGKAEVLIRWLQEQAATLGPLPDLSPVLPLPVTPVLLDPAEPVLVPLERVSLAGELDGSLGSNRSPAFCLVAARNDLEAIQAYLYKFRAQDKTRRAYQKELERFLLWCIHKARKPLSSVLVDHCERYKDFLAAPDPDWCGIKALRFGPRWRPFVGPLSPASQRYTVTILRGFFAWLVEVRYLAGNPWVAVGDPPVARAMAPLQLDKALNRELWEKLARLDGLLDQLCATAEPGRQAQYRLVRAVLLLLGYTGLRREEAAHATRNHLRPLRAHPAGLWELDVLGKRNRWRTVFLPPRVVAALDAHWQDREQDFSNPGVELALISPVLIPPTESARNKHLDADDGSLTGNGFSPDGLYRAVKTVLLRLADDPRAELEPDERNALRRAAPHALRHTFGTRAAAQELPLDVLQRVLGHASLQTTTIYVQAERRRSIEEMGKFFGQG
ncbi:phage integrase family protein [Zoogloea sp.]|uniref:phage integrase family protein n=1 Tax=Zoogloea sp. TaxID=49181 RepID=UPI002631371E|nr:phage integrase family protein [Zoogloea sp.]MDD3352840.1 phage integrase family protein [Zoogloea sp.]